MCFASWPGQPCSHARRRPPGDPRVPDPDRGLVTNADRDVVTNTELLADTVRHVGHPEFSPNWHAATLAALWALAAPPVETWGLAGL